MHVNDCIVAALQTQTGLDLQLNDMLLVYYQNNGATSDNLDDAEREFLLAQGATPANENDMWFEFTGTLGGTGALADRLSYYWCTLQGALGPTTVINVDAPCDGCVFDAPTTECTTDCTYTATPINFTEPIVSYTWSITGDGTITAGAGTAMVTVESTGATNQGFTLTCTIAAATESDEGSRAFVQRHTDETIAPTFIGPNINNVTFTEGVDIGTFDFSVVFAGYITSYALIGTWPTGLSIDSSGVLTGTPTGIDLYPDLQVQASSTHGSPISNTFAMDITDATAESLVVSQVAAGSCEWDSPATTCVATGTYLAAASGFTNEPDEWVWTVTSGSATIVSGQGTDQVTVSTDATDDAVFTLKCVATDSQNPGDTAQDLTQFTHTHAEAAGVVFDALTFDPDTYEMLGVKVGTGGLSAVSSSTHYARDHEGVYQQFAANTPVYSGGRCVLTGGAGSLVDKVYADDGAGAPLPEVPWLQHYPAATNQTTYSNDTATWTVINPGTTASDQIGLTGAANSAFIVTDDITTNRSFVRSATFPSSVLDQKYVYKYWIKKDIGNPNYGYFGGYDAVGRDWRVTFNMGTGLVGSAVGNTDSTEVIDDGDWWILMIEFTSSAAGRTYKHEIYPAYNTTGGVTSDNTLTGSVVIGNSEYHADKTIAQVRGLGPIFTTTAAVATTATVYDNDIANHDDNAAYYAEIVLTDADHTTNHIEVDTPTSGNIFGTGVGGLLVTTDNVGSINVSGSVINTTQKVGVVHTTGGQKAINLNGVWGIDTGAGSWTTALNALRYGGGSDYPFKIRNVQRYDGTDYAALKAIIDGLMV